MKRIFVCLVGVLVICGCLCGCSMNGTQDEFVTASPVITVAPDMLPKPDNGLVDDTDGLIEDAEERDSEKRDDTAASTATPGTNTSPSPKATASAAPKMTETPKSDA